MTRASGGRSMKRKGCCVSACESWVLGSRFGLGVVLVQRSVGAESVLFAVAFAMLMGCFQRLMGALTWLALVISWEFWW